VAQKQRDRRDFAQLCDLIANIPGTQQDVVNRKTALQTTENKKATLSQGNRAMPQLFFSV